MTSAEDPKCRDESKDFSFVLALVLEIESVRACGNAKLKT